MRLNLATLIMMFISFFSSITLAQQANIDRWEYIGKSKGRSFFLLEKRTRTNKGTMKAWTKVTNEDDDEVYATFLYEYDCRNKIQRGLLLINYNSEDVIIRVVKEDWESVSEQGTIGYALMTKACSK